MARCARRNGAPLTLAAFVTVLTIPAMATAQAPAPAQPEDVDHAIVFELGAAADWSRVDGFHPGGTFAFEVTAVERWLELEVGFTAIRNQGGFELPVDVLFKKPWRFSPRFEFMIGAGPELIQATGLERGTFWGVSSVLDFMFWPTRNIGWYVEPGYEVTFRERATHHGVALAAGLLIGR
jgi:hypothetical protein